MPAELIRVRCDSCGAEIDLDAETVKVKKDLRKAVECAICRNRRVARNLEMSARRLAGEEVEEATPEMKHRPVPNGNAGFF